MRTVTTSIPGAQRTEPSFVPALDDVLAGLAPRRILEIGVGEGHVPTRLRERFPGVPVVSIDVFGDATTLPFADDSFDLVLAIDVLANIPSPSRALDELSRVCSGTFVAAVPFEPLWRASNIARGRHVRQFGNTPGHVNHWNRWSFQRFVGTRFHVQQTFSPLPWTMVRAIPR
jgi:SAM-dependent methyltransferase